MRTKRSYVTVRVSFNGYDDMNVKYFLQILGYDYVTLGNRVLFPVKELNSF